MLSMRITWEERTMMSNADELAKLDALRRSGALFQEEFELEKGKLLGTPLPSVSAPLVVPPPRATQAAQAEAEANTEVPVTTPNAIKRVLGVVRGSDGDAHGSADDDESDEQNHPPVASGESTVCSDLATLTTDVTNEENGDSVTSLQADGANLTAAMLIAGPPWPGEVGQLGQQFQTATSSGDNTNLNNYLATLEGQCGSS
jgi:hypothetical protein